MGLISRDSSRTNRQKLISDDPKNRETPPPATVPRALNL